MEKVKNMQSKWQQSKPYNKQEIFLDLKEELKNMMNKEQQYTIPIFIPHKGCPNECVFCNQRKISGQVKNLCFEEVDKIISQHLAFLQQRKNKRIEVAFFGGSFTGIPLTEQIAYLKIANQYLKAGRIHAIRISTRPDYISISILKVLKKYHVDTIELGVQSMIDQVLQASKRGHLAKDVIRASRLIQLFHITLGHQIMIGLPKSTLQNEVETIQKCLYLKPEQLRIYPVYVIFPSELYTMYELGEYKPLTLQEAIDRVYAIVKECIKTDVKIIRIGLQSTDEITKHNEKIIGPVCDNFAEYVYAKMIKEKIENQLLPTTKKVIIKVPQKYISMTIGPKKINKEYFESNYHLDYQVIGY